MVLVRQLSVDSFHGWTTSVFSKSKLVETTQSRTSMRIWEALWKEPVSNKKRSVSFSMNQTVCHLLSWKRWMHCWLQVKFQVFSKDKNICCFCLNSRKAIAKEFLQMNKSTSHLSEMSKEIYTLSLRWIPTILISLTEQLHHLLSSTDVSSIGLEIGLKKDWFRSLNNSLW